MKRLARGFGFEVEHTSKHIRVLSGDKQIAVFPNGTKGVNTYRALQNFKATLKRAAKDTH